MVPVEGVDLTEYCGRLRLWRTQQCAWVMRARVLALPYLQRCDELTCCC